MFRRLNTKDADFYADLNKFLDLDRNSSKDISNEVKEILLDVKSGGNEALFLITERLDSLKLNSDTLRVSGTEISKAISDLSAQQTAALEEAAIRIENYHQNQIPKDLQYTDDDGVELGYRWNAIESVGLYVPGGKAAYPSSVLMSAIPARVAGVPRLVMTVPAPGGSLNPLVLAAANRAGVDEIYKIGGAQAIAALAYGTESINSVDKIVGPGNAFVAEAKRQVFGTVGIDMIAGPSEILVYADSNNNSSWIAMDLLSQAEHDENAQSILITEDENFADEVSAEINSHLSVLPRADIASLSWNTFGAIILVNDSSEAISLINRIAPEHLELARDDADEISQKINNAGAIFLGHFTPEAVGDYIAGPSHVLPTSRSARFSSGLSVIDFLKRTSLIRCDLTSLKKIGSSAVTLAEAEGLTAHALSIKLRIN